MDFSSQCGRVSTARYHFPKPKEIIGLLEADFAEDKSPDKACSQNDLQFLKHLETNIVQCEDGHLQMLLPFKTRPNLPSNKERRSSLLSDLRQIKVAPTKVVKIPRLELTAAVVSAKVHSMLKEELEYHDAEDFFWTDSQVVLGYIHNDARRFHTFVANRVQLIRDRTSPDQWHYVSTDQNPADHASRGLSVSQLGSTNWFQGPSFLWEKDFAVGSISPLAVGDPEVRATNLSTTTHSEPLNLLSRLTRISSWKMMIKVLARLRMVVKGARQGSLVRERKDAELFVLRLVQQEAYPEEIKALTSDKTVKTTSTIHDLDPINFDGITRVKGRLGELSTEVAHPVILPKRSPITRAIIRHFHEDIKHQGRGMTQNHLRANGFWIVNGFKVVAEVLRKCVSCRRLRRPQEEQKMANLPRDRVEPSGSFHECGYGLFRSFLCKERSF
nr:uncharacterized protein LOC129264731 [Lytechinus pictus]